MSYIYPAVGPSLKGNECHFAVWAPDRKNVEVKIGSKFIAMKKDERGYWSANIPDVGLNAKYLYRLDGDQELPDPASRWQPTGVHGPSAVPDTNFEWSDTDWKGLPLRDMIIYELHVGTFTKEGTFDGVISRLPYLKHLGVNTIELMPVAQFPGSRNWGYDGVFPFAVQDSYGGITGLKRLVNEAHAQGIAILLDVVYNHLGPEGNYLAAYGPYFTDKYKTGWGKAMNFDDAGCDAVRNYFWQNALMWLDDFHIDGLRLDAVHAIWDFSARHFIGELSAKVKALEKEKRRTKVLIAEFDLNNPRYITDPSQGGLGLDGQWCDEFHHALHALVSGETDGYYEDFGKAEHLAKTLQESYVYTGEYSVHRKKHFGTTPSGTTFDQFVVFCQNHDQVGNRMLGDRLSHQLSFEALKLTAATYLLSAHTPMLFMGEEYGEKNPFQYFISHGDKELVELIRKGRRDEFSYFNWVGDIPDPQSEETFRQCILSWEFENDEKADTLLRFYRHLISFRKERRALQGKDRGLVHARVVQGKKLIIHTRSLEEDAVFMILNFEKSKVEFHESIPFAARRIFDSSSEEWGGPGSPATVDAQPFTLNPESIVVFEKLKK